MENGKWKMENRETGKQETEKPETEQPGTEEDLPVT